MFIWIENGVEFSLGNNKKTCFDFEIVTINHDEINCRLVIVQFETKFVLVKEFGEELIWRKAVFHFVWFNANDLFYSEFTPRHCRRRFLLQIIWGEIVFIESNMFWEFVCTDRPRPIQNKKWSAKFHPSKCKKKTNSQTTIELGLIGNFACTDTILE